MLRLLTLLVLLSTLWVSVVSAQGVPSTQYPAKPVNGDKPNATLQQSFQHPQFYGYVPPAPIRHTWPGGYRVIFQELTNTFIDHVLGRY